MHDHIQQLLELKARLPSDLLGDIGNLESLLRGSDFQPVLNKIRYITEKILFELCTQHNIRWGKDEITLESMIGPLKSKNLLPRNVAIYVETIQRHGSAGSHFQRDPLSNAHVAIATIALNEFLNWHALGSRLDGTLHEPRDGGYGPAPADYAEWVMRALEAADSTQGLNILNNALEREPNNIVYLREKLRRLVELGAVQQATALAGSMRAEVHGHFPTLLLLARAQAEVLRKRLNPTPQDRERLLEHSRALVDSLLQHSRSAADELGSCHAAVSIAVQLVMNDSLAAARKLAGRCRHGCANAAAAGSRDEEGQCLLRLTTAKASLIEGTSDGVEALLKAAAAYLTRTSNGDRLALLARERAQLLCLQTKEMCPSAYVALFKTPQVVVFTGHMMDKADRLDPRLSGRANARFTPNMEADLTECIRAELDKMDARIGFGSAACGGDIIFLEQMLARNGEIHVVLPYNQEKFKEDCLRDYMENPGMEWERRFNAVIGRAQVHYLGKSSPPDNSMVSECCNRVFLGLALRKAEELSSEIRLLAFWDGRSGDATGGTYAMVELAKKRSLDWKNVYADVLARAQPTQSSGAGATSGPFVPANSASLKLGQQICAVLFADVSGFSQLDEAKLPEFLDRYLSPLSGLIEEAGANKLGPLDFNTWGDGLYCVFDSVAKAGSFALRLQNLAATGKWRIAGLGEELRLRVGLHAGSVYCIQTPAALKDTFLGGNINFAAKIEPVTPAGEVYCSETFAALAAVEGVADFSCEYVRDMPLAKDAGFHPLYVLRGRALN